MLLSSGSSWPAEAERQLCFTEAIWIPEYLAQKGPSSELQKTEATIMSAEQAIYHGIKCSNSIFVRCMLIGISVVSGLMS